MLGFDAIIDQERPIRILRSHLQNGTVPHALLFTGIEGVGKKTTAAALAMAVNCTGAAAAAEAPCGSCTACRKISADKHPDVQRVSAAGAMIRIDQVRELCRQLSLRPYEARTRVAILADAQTLNPAAGNALLKMLEEPPPRTLLILTAAQPQDLLPTIVSRCQHLRFKPIARRHLAAILERAYGFERQAADITAALADGSVTRALDFQRRERLKRRNWLVSELDLRRPKSAIWPSMLAEKMAASKAEALEDLALIAAWLRDMAVAAVDPERILYFDLRERIVAEAQHAPAGFPVRAAAALGAARRRIEANANPRLTLEAFLAKMAAPERLEREKNSILC